MSYGPEHRRRALQLGAMSASVLVLTIPGLFDVLTSKQMEHIQMVLDAAVLNPVLRQEADDAYKASVVAQSGNLVSRDPAKVARADKLYGRIIPIDENDKRIRLDWHKLLKPDALHPRSNNPDEADYLARVRTTLDHRGIWLRMGQPFVRDADRRAMIDPRRWQIWFSLGPDGDTVPSGGDAVIDREELLSTTMLGAGYYRAVWTGDVQSRLERLSKQIYRHIEEAEDDHRRLIKRRDDAFPGVAEISDWKGGAVMPPYSIWQKARDWVVVASNYNLAGDVVAAQAYLFLAANWVQVGANQLAEYEQRSRSGAASMVKILTVVAVVGAVAGTIASFGGGGARLAALLRGGSAGRAAGATGAARNLAIAEGDLGTFKALQEAEGQLVQVIKTAQSASTKLGSGARGGQSIGAGTGYYRW